MKIVSLVVASGGSTPGRATSNDHRPGSALRSPAYCFASVIVWTENNNVTISDRFICFILTVKRRWRPVFWGRQLRKGRQLFRRKTCIRVTWLEGFLTTKWRGSFTALGPPLFYCAKLLTDRQTDRRTDGQTDGQTDRQTDRWTNARHYITSLAVLRKSSAWTK